MHSRGKVLCDAATAQLLLPLWMGFCSGRLYSCSKEDLGVSALISFRSLKYELVRHDFCCLDPRWETTSIRIEALGKKTMDSVVDCFGALELGRLRSYQSDCRLLASCLRRHCRDFTGRVVRNLVLSHCISTHLVIGCWSLLCRTQPTKELLSGTKHSFLYEILH